MTNRAKYLYQLADSLTAQAAIARELADSETASVDEVFTSNAPPPGISRRQFRTWCVNGRVEGATKAGHVWTCSRAAWFAATRPATPTNVVSIVTRSDEDLANEMLAAAGYRLHGAGR